jgi:glycosyltransferase involved in cell wall biosynthesis
VKTLFKKLNHLICETESDRRELIAMGVPSEKMTVIPNGVNEEFFKPSSEGLSKSVIWHGRFIPQKGLPDMIRSARIISESVPSVKFELSGWGPQLSGIKELVRSSGVASKFVFRGKQPWDSIPSWLSQGHVYVMPSYREGMPYALLETMSCGTPAVAYSFPAATEIIEDGVDGFLVDIGDYKSLAKYTVQLLLDDDLRGKMGINARKKIEDQYSWYRIAQRYNDVYEGLSI